MNISNTKKDTYYQCARKYKLKYIDRIDVETLSSPLFFGRAVDEALNHMLLQKKKEKLKEEKGLLKQYKSYKDLFHDIISKPTKNGEVLEIDGDKVLYSKADLDTTLIDGTFDIGKIEELILVKNRTKEEEKLIKQASFSSLYNKGLMLLEVYEKEILPKIKEVISIQEEVKLPDGNGNFLTGIIDFVGVFEDEPDKVYVIDNKTTSSKYTKDSAEISEQLATYCEYKQNFNAAYIVLDKNIRKREPRVRYQIIKSEINEDSLHKTFDKYDNMRDNIEKGEFAPNFSSRCFFFGRKCEYYNLCHNNDNIGLVKLESKNGK